ncbi:hypothetical protein HK405_013706, partial [Cladochytrium tenue]
SAPVDFRRTLASVLGSSSLISDSSANGVVGSLVGSASLGPQNIYPEPGTFPSGPRRTSVSNLFDVDDVWAIIDNDFDSSSPGKASSNGSAVAPTSKTAVPAATDPFALLCMNSARPCDAPVAAPFNVDLIGPADAGMVSIMSAIDSILSAQPNSLTGSTSSNPMSVEAQLHRGPVSLSDLPNPFTGGVTVNIDGGFIPLRTSSEPNSSPIENRDSSSPGASESSSPVVASPTPPEQAMSEVASDYPPIPLAALTSDSAADHTMQPPIHPSESGAPAGPPVIESTSVAPSSSTPSSAGPSSTAHFIAPSAPLFRLQPLQSALHGQPKSVAELIEEGKAAPPDCSCRSHSAAAAAAATANATGSKAPPASVAPPDSDGSSRPSVTHEALYATPPLQQGEIPPEAVEELLDLYFLYCNPNLAYIVHEEKFRCGGIVPPGWPGASARQNGPAPDSAVLHSFAWPSGPGERSPLLMWAMCAYAARFSKHPSLATNPSQMHHA